MITIVSLNIELAVTQREDYFLFIWTFLWKSIYFKSINSALKYTLAQIMLWYGSLITNQKWTDAYGLFAHFTLEYFASRKMVTHLLKSVVWIRRLINVIVIIIWLIIQLLPKELKAELWAKLLSYFELCSLGYILLRTIAESYATPKSVHGQYGLIKQLQQCLTLVVKLSILQSWRP